MFDDFDTTIQSDEFAWKYEEELAYEAEARKIRQENIQEESACPSFNISVAVLHCISPRRRTIC